MVFFFFFSNKHENTIVTKFIVGNKERYNCHYVLFVIVQS
jgi:hypothetical protein